jgi:hypothetical protein
MPEGTVEIDRTSKNLLFPHFIEISTIARARFSVRACAGEKT